MNYNFLEKIISSSSIRIYSNKLKRDTFQKIKKLQILINFKRSAGMGRVE
jgi:hypothetical protein